MFGSVTMISDTDKLLTQLNQQLELRGAPAISIVICGGSALNVMGLVTRTTKDIDILGQLVDDEVIEPNFPEVFWEAAETIAKEFDLDEKWINDEPALMVKTGLPEGLTDRLTIKTYGECLKAGFIGRIDQIHFKLWAAADRDERSYHVEDLQKLNPTSEEIKRAAKWCLQQDPSEGFRMVLTDMLHQLGFDDVAESI